MRNLFKKTLHALPAVLDTASIYLCTLGAKNATEKGEVNSSDWTLIACGFVGSVLSLGIRRQVIKKYYPDLHDFQTSSEAVGRVGLQVATGTLIATTYPSYAWMIGAPTLAAMFSLINDREIYQRADNYVGTNIPYIANCFPSILPWKTETFPHKSPRQQRLIYAGWAADRSADFLIILCSLAMARTDLSNSADWSSTDVLNITGMAVSAFWLLRKWIFCCDAIYSGEELWGEFDKKSATDKLIHVPARRLMLAWPMFILAKIADDVFQQDFSSDALWFDGAQVIMSISLILLFEKDISAPRLQQIRRIRTGDHLGLPSSGSGVVQLSPSPSHTSLQQQQRPANYGTAGDLHRALLQHQGEGDQEPEPAADRNADNHTPVEQAPSRSTPTPQSIAAPVVRPPTPDKKAQFIVVVVDRIPPRLSSFKLSQHLQQSKSGSPLTRSSSQEAKANLHRTVELDGSNRVLSITH